MNKRDLLLRRRVMMGESNLYREFVQPIMTEDVSIGGDAFGVSVSEYASAYYAYYMFDSNNYTSWVTLAETEEKEYFAIIYNPFPLLISTIEFRNRHVGGSTTKPLEVINFYGSNDGVDYEFIKQHTNTVLSANTSWSVELHNVVAYRYVKINTTSDVGVAIAGINLTAKELLL